MPNPTPSIRRPGRREYTRDVFGRTLLIIRETPSVSARGGERAKEVRYAFTAVLQLYTLHREVLWRPPLRLIMTRAHALETHIHTMAHTRRNVFLYNIIKTAYGILYTFVISKESRNNNNNLKKNSSKSHTQMLNYFLVPLSDVGDFSIFFSQVSLYKQTVKRTDERNVYRGCFLPQTSAAAEKKKKHRCSTARTKFTWKHAERTTSTPLVSLSDY